MYFHFYTGYRSWEKKWKGNNADLDPPVRCLVSVYFSFTHMKVVSYAFIQKFFQDELTHILKTLTSAFQPGYVSPEFAILCVREIFFSFLKMPYFPW